MANAESPVRALRHQPAKTAEVVAIPDTLPTELSSALNARGIRQLYSHQAASLEHARAGRNVVVVTPTARQDAVLQPARARPRSRIRAYSSPPFILKE
jgi:hypothetical protein